MISYASTVSAFLFLSSCPSLAFPGLKLREVCYETDTLLSFQLWIDDSTPFCSSLLSISDFTSFVGPTKYLTTTITTVTETSYDTVETVTVPQTTAFTAITDTPPLGGILHKRQANISSVPLLIAPVPIIATATGNDPIVTNFPSIAQNASLAAEAYSACSCLRLTSSTITTQPSILITRTINGIDYEALGTTTLTSGTITVTTTLSDLPLPVTSQGVSIPTIPAPSSGFLPLPTNISTGYLSVHPFPTLNISTIPTFSVSAGIFPSFNGTVNSLPAISGRPSPLMNLTAYPTVPRSGFLPLPTINLTANSSLPRSGFLPLPTVNLTTNFNASISGRLPKPILNATASGRIPLPFTNATRRPWSPVTGFFPLPTLNGTNRTLPLSGSLPLPTNISLPISAHLPLPILNGTNRTLPWFGTRPTPTGILLPPILTKPSLHAPHPTANLTSLLPLLPPPVSPLPKDPTANPTTTTTTSTPPLPVGTQIAPPGCPSINSSTYTTPSGDTYQLRCAIYYPARAFADLDEPDFLGCIQKCSNVNEVFAESVCRGVSFLQYETGVKCTLLAQAEITGAREDEEAVSAVLVGRGGGV